MANLLICGIGLAYGALAGLSPVYGIYTTFFTGLTYIIFGTSRHLSVGTHAIVSLMVLSAINKVEQKYTTSPIGVSNVNSTLLDVLTNSTSEIPNYELKLKISSSLAFWCGIFQVVS